MTLAIWVALAALVGWYYKKAKGGSFWLAFIGSAVLSPLIIFILALLSKKKVNIEQ